MHRRRPSLRDRLIRFAVIVALLDGSTPPVGAAEPAPPEAAAAKPSGNTLPGPVPAARFPTPKIYPEPTEAERRIAAALTKRVDFHGVEVQLVDVVARLGKTYDIPIQMDMSALTADGKGSEMLINKTVRGISLKNLLRLILDEQGLTAIVSNDVLLITTRLAAESRVIARVYQVHDLVVMPNDPTASQPEFESLIELITATILPETWREAGGTQGELKPFDGPGILALVITQTEDGHEQIERLLAALRAAQADPIRDVQRQRPVQAKPPTVPPVVLSPIPVVG